MNPRNLLIAALTFSCSITFNTSWAEDNNGNRYFKDRQYNSEISASETYLDMMRNKITVIDVRRLREYAAGHPERAYNVPYPHIIDNRDQDAATFYWEVYDVVHGNVDTPIATLCRTGSRSVDAANILADPLNTANDPTREAVPDAIPFTNVRNIWEGFVGQHKYAYAGGDIAHDVDDGHTMLNLANTDPFPLSDVADVYEHTTDANPNKDGWRNFMNLPWSTHIQKPLAYQQSKEHYECWQTDEGC